MLDAITFLIGIVIGLSSGLFGIGGALVSTPMLNLWVGLTAKLALATPLPATIPAAISGSVAYSKARLVRFDVVKRMLLAAMPLNILGAYLTSFAPDVMLLLLTGVVLAYSSWLFVRRGFRKGAATAVQEAEQPFGTAAYIAGAAAGFVSGFLAIGGGIVMVPAFVKILRLPTKIALATSLLCVAALAVPGVIVHALLGHIDWHVSLVLSVAVVPSGYLGARLATSLRTVTIERLYGSLMLCFAVYFLIVNLLRL